MSALFGLGGTAKTAATQPQRANGLQFNASDYGKPLPLVYGRARVPGIVIWYGDFKAKETKQQTGKGGGASITTYTYSFSFALAFAEGPISGIRSMWINSAKVTAQPDVVRLGTPAQATWSHWGVDALTGPALSYPNTAWAAWLNWNAGSSPSAPQVNFEIDGLLQFNSGGGIYGADPSAIISDLFGNSVHGSNWAWLGDLTQYHDYCVANSLFLSPVYDTETTLTNILTQLLQITNTEPVWSGGALKLLPRSDDAAAANGAVYTPVSAIVADLGPDDFLGPVQIDRKPDGDLYNIVRVEWINAAANYVTSVAEAKDLAHISLHNERAMQTIQAHDITDPVIAAQVAQTILQNQLHTRNIFTFELPLTKIGLESMDKVTLTDPLAGLDHEPVRIVDIVESGDLAFQVIAEEFPAGVAQGAAYALEVHAGFSPNPEAAPDTTAEPVFFRAPSGMAGVAGTPAVWAGVAGSGPNWGGANVWASFDNASFSHVGAVHPGARYGLLKTALAAGADPDVANSCELNLIGPGQLTGGSNGDADNGITLILIDQELIGYSATTLNTDGSYTIGANYLRRGMYGTAIAAHAVDAPWLRVDDNFFSWSFAHDDVGKTIYLKFQAFNLYGGGTEDLATAPTYSYVLGSAEEVPDMPPVPFNPQVLSVADGISITWTNSNPAAVAKTQVQVSPDGAAWSELEQTAGEISTHHFTGGQTYYYRLRARSAAFVWSAYTATISSTGKVVAAGATAGATIGPGGNVGGAVDGNGRAVIDWANGLNLNQNADYMAAGSFWSPVLLSSLTGGNVDLALSAVQGRHLGNIGDATGRYAVANGAGLKGVSLVDGSNRAGVDFANGLNLNQNLDNLPNGVNRIAWDPTSRARALGSDNLIQNGDFSRGDNLNWNADSSDHPAVTSNCVASIVASGSSVAGGYVGSLPGATTYLGSYLIPVDTSKRYYMALRVQNGGAGAANFYAGFACLDVNKQLIAADGAGTYNYNLASNIPQPAPYTLYDGIATGEEAAGSPSPSAFTSNSKFRHGTKYIVPMILPASAAPSESLNVDYFRVLEIDTAIVNHPRAQFINDSGYLDFSQPHLFKTQDYMPSGTTYGRILNANLYGSGAPSIDFSSGYHTNKSLINIADGGGRYAASEAGADVTSAHTSALAASLSNHSLDNLPDGAVYARVNAARVGGSAYPFVDFADGNNLNKNADNIAPTATNKFLGADRVQNADLFVKNVGAALNADPSCSDPTAWTDGGTGSPEMITGRTDIPGGGSTAIGNVHGSSMQIWNASPIPIDQGRNYRFEIMVRQVDSTAATAYLFVAWADAAGNILSANVAQPTGAGSPAGWVNGSYSYFDLINSVVPTVWTRYVVTFGPNQLKAVPSNARSIRIGALANQNASAGQVQLTNIRVTPIVSLDDETVDGSTYGRPLLSRLSSGNPIMDFSAGYHLNKNADNIAPTTTNLFLGANRVATAHLQNYASDVTKLAPNAATKVAALYSGSGSTSGTDGITYNTIVSVTITTRGGPTSIGVSGVANGGAPTVNYLVTRDGSNIEPASLIGISALSQPLRFSIFHSETPPAGTHTYTFKVSKFSSGDPVVNFSNCSIHILEATN